MLDFQGMDRLNWHRKVWKISLKTHTLPLTGRECYFKTKNKACKDVCITSNSIFFITVHHSFFSPASEIVRTEEAWRQIRKEPVSLLVSYGATFEKNSKQQPKIKEKMDNRSVMITALYKRDSLRIKHNCIKINKKNTQTIVISKTSYYCPNNEVSHSACVLFDLFFDQYK